MLSLRQRQRPLVIMRLLLASGFLGASGWGTGPNPSRSGLLAFTHKVQPWTDAQIAAVCHAHRGHLRLLPEIMTGCGLRIAQALALAVGDFDFDEKILHVSRQFERLGKDHVYALPKNDRERDVPLPDWAAAAMRAHLSSYPAWTCTLPWEKATGKPQTHNLLFHWVDGSYVRYRNYRETVWKPALPSAGIIARRERG